MFASRPTPPIHSLPSACARGPPRLSSAPRRSRPRGEAAADGAGSPVWDRVSCSPSPGASPRDSNELSGLSLAAGIALAETLAAGGFERVMLKWPNDLVVGDRKLAGILVEASHSRAGGAACVVGVGFNLDLAPGDSGGIDQPWTDFAREFGRVPGRSSLAARAANAILDACEQYRDRGLAAFATRWAERDALRDRQVRVLPAGGRLRGLHAESTKTARCSSNTPGASSVVGPARSGCGRSMSDGDRNAAGRCPASSRYIAARHPRSPATGQRSPSTFAPRCVVAAEIVPA